MRLAGKHTSLLKLVIATETVGSTALHSAQAREGGGRADGPMLAPLAGAFHDKWNL